MNDTRRPLAGPDELDGIEANDVELEARFDGCEGCAFRFIVSHVRLTTTIHRSRTALSRGRAGALVAAPPVVARSKHLATADDLT